MNNKIVQKILNKFLQIIRQADYSVVDADTSAYPKGQATSDDKPTNIARLSTYGICANPPKGCHILMLQNQGQESSKFGIFNDFLNRKKGLAEGECALYNTLTGAIVYMKADGSITIESDTSIDADAPVINIDADTEVNVTAPTINANATTANVNATTVNIIASSDINMTAPAINMTGVVTVTGTMSVTGALSGGGMSASGGTITSTEAVIGGITFTSHVHVDVVAGNENTGGPQ